MDGQIERQRANYAGGGRKSLVLVLVPVPVPVPVPTLSDRETVRCSCMDLLRYGHFFLWVLVALLVLFLSAIAQG